MAVEHGDGDMGVAGWAAGGLAADGSIIIAGVVASDADLDEIGGWNIYGPEHALLKYRKKAASGAKHHVSIGHRAADGEVQLRDSQQSRGRVDEVRAAAEATSGIKHCIWKVPQPKSGQYIFEVARIGVAIAKRLDSGELHLRPRLANHG